MALATRIESIKKIWQLMLSDTPLPDVTWLGSWLRFPDLVIEHGIQRAGKKFKTAPADPSEVWKYVSSVIRSEADKREQEQQELKVNAMPITQIMRRMP